MIESFWDTLPIETKAMIEEQCYEEEETDYGIAKVWRRAALIHRDNDLPAMIYDNGRLEWYIMGESRRNNGLPAVKDNTMKGKSLWDLLPMVVIEKIREYGYIIEYRDNMQRKVWKQDHVLHRLGGPAVIWENGTQEWYKNGKPHREGDRPAVVHADNTQYWYKNGKPHRGGDKPAVILPDGTRKWCTHGMLHRDGDKPAVICSNGDRFWYRHGKRHRYNDLPAVILADGTQQWYKNGELSRENGKPVYVIGDPFMSQWLTPSK